MGATFSRVKNWTTEIVTNTDLNAEFDNILNNLGPAGVDDYSTNAAQMRLQTSPGDVGSESLATALSGELERIRYILAQIKGSAVSYWYEPATSSLTDLAAAVSGGFPANRISSGKTTGNSSQLVALVPSGSTLALTLDGTPTSFNYYISDIQYSITADVTLTGLSGAPATNNTCVFNDPNIDGSQYTNFLGEYGTQLTISGAGSELASRVGSFQAFSTTASGTTEYFVGYLNSTSAITKAWRGCFFTASQTAAPRLRVANGSTVTLQRLAWIFSTTSSSMAVTYNTPTYASIDPAAPSSGDYWYDLTNNVWKIYNSTSWVAANATLIGMSIQTSAACVAARTFDKFISTSDLNTMQLEWVSSSVLQIKEPSAIANVFGTSLAYGLRPLQWDMASHLDAGLTESASTIYYMYLKESGAPLISDKTPTDLRGTRRGFYHPTETWRAIGCARNNISSNIDPETLYSFSQHVRDLSMLDGASLTGANYRVQVTTAASTIAFKVTDRLGNYPSDLVPTYVSFRDATLTNGNNVVRAVRSSLNITIPSTATMGHSTSASSYLFLYACNETAGMSLCVNSVPSKTSGLQDITAIGTGSDYARLWGSNVTSRPISFLARAKWGTGVNGTWTTPDQFAVECPNEFDLGDLINISYTHTPSGTTLMQHQVSATNFIVIGPGTWKIEAAWNWVANGNFPTNTGGGLFAANGANNSGTPALLSSVMSLIGGEAGGDVSGSGARNVIGINGQLFDFSHAKSQVTVNVTASAGVYAVPSSSAPGGVGVLIFGNMYARRVSGLTS